MRPLALWLALMLLAGVTTAAADDVVITVKNGALVVKGDAAANSLRLDAVGLADDAVRATPGGSTTVNGVAGPQIFTGLVSGVTITLGDGADVLTLSSMTRTGKVTIKTGKGSDRLTLDSATMRGPATIDLGGGDNALASCSARFEADVIVKLGKGTGGPVTVDCGGAESASSVDASVMIAADATFDGDLTVKAPAAVHIAVLNDTNVLGASTFKNVALLALCYDLLAGPVSAKMPKILGGFGGEVECSGGSATAEANGNTAIAMAGSTLGGSFTVKGAAGGDTVVVTGTSIAGATTMSLASGFNFLFFDQVQTASLLAKAGKHDDDLFADALTVAGDLVVKYGAGLNVIDLGTSAVGGDLTVKTGGGNDSITANGVTLNGVRTIDTGKGADVVN